MKSQTPLATASETDPPLARIGALLIDSTPALQTAMRSHRTQILRAEWQILTECIELNDRLAEFTEQSFVAGEDHAEDDALLARHAIRLQQQVAELVSCWKKVWSQSGEHRTTHA